MGDSSQVERLVYNWCTQESRGTDSARALAAIYASIYMDRTPMLKFQDMRALDRTRLQWAFTLIESYVAGKLTVPWSRAVALVALYDLLPEESV